MTSRPLTDPHTDLPSEIRIIYPILIGLLLAYWITTSWSSGWTAAILILVAWWYTSRRQPIAQEQPSHFRVAILADSPGPWAEWRVRTIANYGKCVPVLAPIEFACQWIWFLFTQWAIGPVVATTVVLFAVLTPPRPDPHAATRDAQIAYAAAFAAPGVTTAGSVRRTALLQLVESGVGLGRAKFDEWDLSGVVALADCEFEGATFRHATLHGAALRGADLENTDWNYADCYGTNFAGAGLRHAKLQRSLLVATDLSGIDARYADFGEARLDGANLHGANLEFARFQNASLEQVDAREANLSHADLSHARLFGADLRGARCVDADLSHTDLGAAVWDEDDLGGARWRADSVKLPADRAAWLTARSRRVNHDGVDWILITQ